MTLVEGISQCEQLAQAVRRGPLAVDLAYPYHPHVTIAHHLADAQLDQAFDELADFECEFGVDDFRLYVHDHELGWTPTRYFPLHAGYLGDMPSLKERLTDRVAEIRKRRPAVDHAVLMQEHYGDDQGGPAGRRRDVLRVPVGLPGARARVLRRRVRRQGLPRGPGHPGHLDQVDVPGADRLGSRTS